MKTRFPAFILILFAAAEMLTAQKAITLRECYGLALKKSALALEKETYNSIGELKENNLSKSWYPSLDANATFTYNSSVVDLGGVFSQVPIPGLEDAVDPMPHEQYRLTLDVNQMIYDGGSVRKAKAAEQAEIKVNQQQTETDLYKIRGQVNSCYFSILLVDRQKELLSSYLDLIVNRLKSMQSALDNGMILKSDIDVMTAEKIKIEQQQIEIDIKRASLISVLSDLAGTAFDQAATLILPVTSDTLSAELMRPELKVFDLRKEQIEAGMGLLQAKRMPRAFGFATLAYGNPPGSDFFRDEFAPFYVVGAGIKWNIFDWNKVKNEKQQLRLQQGMLDSRKADLADNLRRSQELKRAEIVSLKSAIARDTELITLRKRITASAESQYENGTITASELLNEINAQKQAEVNHEIHKISLGMAKVEFMNISGQEIE